MTKLEKIARLAKMKKSCEDAGRDPNRHERKVAMDMLDEIDEEENRDYFDYPEDHKRPAGLPNDFPTENERSKGPFSSLGDQLIAVRNASLPGVKTDNRLYDVQLKRAATGLSESVPSDGSFLLQDDLISDLLMNIWDNNQLIKMCTTFNLSGNSNGIKIPTVPESSRADGSRWGGALAYWIGEAGEKQDSKPAFGQLNLKPNKLVGLCYTTDELLSDVGSLDKYISTIFNQEFDFKITDGIINGTGAGQMLGYITSGGKVEVDAEVGQTTGIVTENVMQMWARHQVSNPKKVVWIANRQIIPSLFQMSISVGTGGVPVFLPANSVKGQLDSTLFGAPIIFSESAPAANSLGDLALCDMSQYLIATKGSIKKDVSLHVRFIFDESVYRFVLRIDGMPSLAQPITPYKGSDTTSPFVVLGARS